MPAPMKYPNELRGRAKRPVVEARAQDLSAVASRTWDAAKIMALECEVHELKRPK